MAHGICKITKGWRSQDSALVDYDDGQRMEISEVQYRALGYNPPFEQLLECTDQQKAPRP